MANLEEIVLALKVENEQFKAQMLASQKAVGDATIKMADSIGKFSEKSSKDVSKFDKVMNIFAGVTLANIATGAFNLVKDAAIGFAKVLTTDAIAAASEAQMANNKLTFALEQTGLGAAKTVQSLNDYASALQVTTAFEDDAIKEAMALIQSLGRLNEEGLKQSTQAALDLSAALGIDLQTAAKAMGKAAQGETGALSKFGLVIDESVPKTERFAVALDMIKERFGGAAVGQAKTYAGAIEQMKNQFGEIQETIGGFIVNNKAVIAVINGAAKVFADFSKTIEENGGSIDKFITDFVFGALDAFAVFVDSLNMIGNAIKIAFLPIHAAFQSIVDVTQWAMNVMTGDFEMAAEELQDTANVFKDFELLPSNAGDSIRQFRDDTAAMADEMKKTKANGGLVGDEDAAKINEVSDSVLKLAQSYVEAGLKMEGARDLQKALFDQQLADLTSSFDSRLEATQKFYDEESALRDAKYNSDFEALWASKEANKITEEDFRAGIAEINARYDADELKAKMDKKKIEEGLQKSRLQTASDTFGALASLSQTGIKELGGIAKAGAISQATIDGIAAVQKALASAPPPFNFIQAAAVGAVTAANVAKIAATPLRSGIDSVPGVGNQDNFPAVLAPGERVVPSKTNSDLTRFLDNQNQQSAPIININLNIPNAIGVTREQAQLIIEGLNEYIAAGGLRLAQ